MYKRLMIDQDRVRREIRMLETRIDKTQDETKRADLVRQLDRLREDVDYRAKRNYGI